MQKFEKMMCGESSPSLSTSGIASNDALHFRCSWALLEMVVTCSHWWGDTLCSFRGNLSPPCTGSCQHATTATCQEQLWPIAASLMLLHFDMHLAPNECGSCSLYLYWLSHMWEMKARWGFPPILCEHALSCASLFLNIVEVLQLIPELDHAQITIVDLHLFCLLVARLTFLLGWLWASHCIMTVIALEIWGSEGKELGEGIKTVLRQDINETRY